MEEDKPMVDLLPEDVIHHIQSFLTGKEAARTAAVSKSWRSAWLTRPDIEFNHSDFYRFGRFQEFLIKTMQRYQDLNLKINSLTLTIAGKLSPEVVAKAVKLGATHLSFSFLYHRLDVVPTELLQSETLTRLSLFRCTIEESFEANWWNLDSLSLHEVTAKDQVFKGIFSSCCLSLEKLQISHCRAAVKSNAEFIALNPSQFQFRNLKVLSLKSTTIHPDFFIDLASRFPSLKDLSVHNCPIEIQSLRLCSPTVERVSLGGSTTLKPVEIDFPRIRILEYSGLGSSLLHSHLRNETFCSEWESHISIHLERYSGVGARFFECLKEFLMGLRMSQISLHLTADSGFSFYEVETGELQLQPIGIPEVVVENLTVDVPQSCRLDLFEGLYGVCTALHINEQRNCER